MRNLRESDHRAIVSVVDEWWGRPMTQNLPRPFFRHFEDTSFVAFLIGFASQSRSGEAYIHFAGVHPSHRKRGMAKALYERFFAEVRGRGCERVRCITSPVNESSIAFHAKMGFEIEAGDGAGDGASIHQNYDGDGGAEGRFCERRARSV